MYVPPLFAPPDEEAMLELIAEVKLGALVTKAGGVFEANHLPFVLRRGGAGQGHRLDTHVALTNPAAQIDEEDCIVIFQGPQDYISPSWYPSRRRHGRVQPSWYYACVHAYGRTRIITHRERLVSHVDEMTEDNERGLPGRWRMAEQPADFNAMLIGQIAAIEVEVTRLVGKWQVGQQRNAEDRAGIVSALKDKEEEGGPRGLSGLVAARGARAAKEGK